LLFPVAWTWPRVLIMASISRWRHSCCQVYVIHVLSKACSFVELTAFHKRNHGWISNA
jgi:hypothetical protein